MTRIFRPVILFRLTALMLLLLYAAPMGGTRSLPCDSVDVEDWDPESGAGKKLKEYVKHYAADTTHHSKASEALRSMARQFLSDSVAEIQADSTGEIKLTRENFVPLLRSGKLSMEDTTVRYPKFIRFCINAYKWFDRNFNASDTSYVRPFAKKGKVKIISDNWFEGERFHPKGYEVLDMVGNLYTNAGLHASYSVLSAGMSFDMNSLFNSHTAKHKKFEFNINTARVVLNIYYWLNDGKTHITNMDNPEKPNSHDWIKFDGLSTRLAGLQGIYIFNWKKFRYKAVYDLSQQQVRSQGSLLAGFHLSFYRCTFDFRKLPQFVADNTRYPFDVYAVDYPSVLLNCGYSYNWRCNRHFMFNATLLPGIGVTFSKNRNTGEHRAQLALGVRNLVGLTYFNKHLFATVSSNFHGLLYMTHDIGYAHLRENFQGSVGMFF